MRRHIPNFLTSMNLVLGCFAIMAAIRGELQQASWFMVCAGILDFFDGFIARALKASSEIGKQLDSLADMVSFGLAPCLIFYNLSDSVFSHTDYPYAAYTALLIVVFSAIRLAKFNIDTRQSDGFIGVPTPANGFLIASFPFFGDQLPALEPLLESPLFCLVFPVVSAWLMVCNIPMLAFKLKSWGWKGNEFRYALLLVIAASISLFRFAGISFAFLAYVSLSVIQYVQTKKHI